MRRREFIRFLGCSFLVCPCVALAQQAAKAQQSDGPVVGFLSTGRRPASPKLIESFFKGLSELNYVDGQNIKIEYRLAEGNSKRGGITELHLIPSWCRRLGFDPRLADISYRHHGVPSGPAVF